MKIKLILAAAANDPLKEVEAMMPLSLPLIAGSAPEHDYIFVDLISGDPVNVDEPVDLVGISSRISGESTAFQLADTFRSRGIPVILGGAQISALPLKALKHADAVVIGEAEPLWPMVLEDLQNGTLKQFYISSPKPFPFEEYRVYQLPSLPDLAKLPVPQRQYFRRKYMFDSVFATRGCGINCDFCSVTNLFGSRVRTRPVEDVIKEIETFGNYFYLLDDTVFGRKETYDYYIDLYTRIGKMKRKRTWIGQGSLDAAADEKGREVIRLAAKAGILWASIGIESLNPEVLKKSGVIAKVGISGLDDYKREIRQNIDFFHQQGIIVSGWFTIGYEEDSPGDYVEAVKFADEANIIPVLSPLKALPGTRLYERLIREGRIDEQATLNIIHPHYPTHEFVDRLNSATASAYSLPKMICRSLWYSRQFRSESDRISRRIHERIFKTIFSFIIQWKFRRWAIKFARSRSTF